jgi:hypothetical protein
MKEYDVMIQALTLHKGRVCNVSGDSFALLYPAEIMQIFESYLSEHYPEMPHKESTVLLYAAQLNHSAAYQKAVQRYRVSHPEQRGFRIVIDDQLLEELKAEFR